MEPTEKPDRDSNETGCYHVRPQCFEFAMQFLGYPEESEVRKYVESLEKDAKRWEYVRDVLAQMHSPKMDNEHSWRFHSLRCATGPTIEAAIDKAIELLR